MASSRCGGRCECHSIEETGTKTPRQSALCHISGVALSNAWDGGRFCCGDDRGMLQQFQPDRHSKGPQQDPYIHRGIEKGRSELGAAKAPNRQRRNTPLPGPGRSDGCSYRTEQNRRHGGFRPPTWRYGKPARWAPLQTGSRPDIPPR